MGKSFNHKYALYLELSNFLLTFDSHARRFLLFLTVLSLAVWLLAVLSYLAYRRDWYPSSLSKTANENTNTTAQ